MDEEDWNLDEQDDILVLWDPTIHNDPYPNCHLREFSGGESQWYHNRHEYGHNETGPFVCTSFARTSGKEYALHGHLFDNRNEWEWCVKHLHTFRVIRKTEYYVDCVADWKTGSYQYQKKQNVKSYIEFIDPKAEIEYRLKFK